VDVKAEAIVAACVSSAEAVREEMIIRAMQMAVKADTALPIKEGTVTSRSNSYANVGAAITSAPRHHSDRPYRCTHEIYRNEGILGYTIIFHLHAGDPRQRDIALRFCDEEIENMSGILRVAVELVRSASMYTDTYNFTYEVATALLPLFRAVSIRSLVIEDVRTMILREVGYGQ
jgi:hypothetical protein